MNILFNATIYYNNLCNMFDVLFYFEGFGSPMHAVATADSMALAADPSYVVPAACRRREAVGQQS
jgi:hypothetical protein